MTFETERLLLRPWEESDAEALYQYASHPAVGPAAGWPAHTSVEDSRAVIRDVLSAPETYAVCLKETGLPIGSVGLIPPEQFQAQPCADEIGIGCWIGVPFWGQGMIPEAIACLLRHAFEDLACTAVWYWYYDGNGKSRRCMEKCGFRPHHSEYEKPCIPLGRTFTEHYGLLTAGEWAERADATAGCFSVP